MQVDVVREFVALNERKRQLEAELDEINKRRMELQAQIIDDMAQAGVQSIRVDDHTVYAVRDVGVAPESSPEELVEALLKSGLDQYVRPTYNTNSLKAFVREIIRDLETTKDVVDEADIKNALPEPLRRAMRVTTFFQLRSRK
jgi:uncharacterized protein YeeX (DUF496 family)